MKVANIGGAIAVVLFFLLSAFGQTGTEGSILGTVVDASGAATPGAVVTVTNIETGVAQKAVSDSSGYFQVLALQRGTYSVTVQKTGFSTWQLQSMELTAQENKRVSPVLQVGASQQEITVQSGVELVQTEQSGVAGSV